MKPKTQFRDSKARKKGDKEHFGSLLVQFLFFQRVIVSNFMFCFDNDDDVLLAATT